VPPHGKIIEIAPIIKIIKSLFLQSWRMFLHLFTEEGYFHEIRAFALPSSFRRSIVRWLVFF